MEQMQTNTHHHQQKFNKISTDIIIDQWVKQYKSLPFSSKSYNRNLWGSMWLWSHTEFVLFSNLTSCLKMLQNITFWIYCRISKVLNLKTRPWGGRLLKQIIKLVEVTKFEKQTFWENQRQTPLVLNT